MASFTLDAFYRDHGVATGLKGTSAELNKTSQRMQAFSKISAAAVLAVGAAFVKFGADSVKAARESNKVTAQTQAVIKSTGGAAKVTAKQVDELASAISKKTGIDDEAIASGENMLLTFTNVRNEVGKGNDIFNQATQTITDMSVALGQDMKTSAMQLGKALNDPVRGMTALRRVGVTFTEEQEKAIKKMVKTGDVLGAQKVILGELRKEFGGSAEAAATWADKAEVAAENVQEAFGQKLVPHLENFSEWFVEEGVPALEDFGGEVQELGGHLSDLAGMFDDFGSSQETTFGDMVNRFGEVNDEIVAWKSRYLNAYATVLEAAAKFNPAMRGNAKAVRAMADEAKAELDGVKAQWLKNQTAIKNRPIIAKAKADIKELEAKVRTAKQRLRETDNQKTQAKIRGEISDLRAKIASARASLNALNGKTVFTYIKTIRTTASGPGLGVRKYEAYGGPIHRDSGGFVPGSSPHIRSDNIPAMLTAGEYVHQVPAVRFWGGGFMGAVNRMDLAAVRSSVNSGGGGNTYIINATHYSDAQALQKALVDLDRQGRLAVIRGR